MRPWVGHSNLSQPVSSPVKQVYFPSSTDGLKGDVIYCICYDRIQGTMPISVGLVIMPALCYMRIRKLTIR